MGGAEGEEVEGEAEPAVEVGVEEVEGGRVVVEEVVVVMVVAEGEEVERGEGGGEEGEEGRGGEEVEEEFGECAADDDVAEWEGREDLVECVLREPADRRVLLLHFRRGWRWWLAAEKVVTMGEVLCVESTVLCYALYSTFQSFELFLHFACWVSGLTKSVTVPP